VPEGCRKGREGAKFLSSSDKSTLGIAGYSKGF